MNDFWHRDSEADATSPPTPSTSPTSLSLLDYDIVDVFTDEAFRGNPLAVVHGAEALTGEQMQTLAREFALSETAFPLTPDDSQRARGATYRLRIFTPVTELPYAGHPSIGTAWVLKRRGLVSAGRAVQACGAGLLPVEIAEGGLVSLAGGKPQWGPAHDPAVGLAASGLGIEAVDPIAPARVCGVGIDYLIVPVRPGALADCAPDLRELRAFAFPDGIATGVYLVSWDRGTATASTRMFTGDLNAAEDPATGSAAGALAVWLSTSGLVPTGTARFTVVQGVEMGRRSTIECTVTTAEGAPVETTISGTAVPIAAGQIRIP